MPNRSSLALAPLAALVSAAPLLSAQTIGYLDADTGAPTQANTTLADGSPVFPLHATSQVPADHLWHLRVDAGNGGDVLASAAGSDSPTLRTRFAWATPGVKYHLYVYYWVAGNGAPTGDQEWDLSVGLSPTALTPHLWSDGTQVTDPTRFDTPVLLSQGDRRLFELDLGEVVASPGTGLTIYVDDHPGDDDRTWYDGVGMYVGPPGTAYCFGDGTGAPCPCGNSGAADAGCANSVGTGAVLAAYGSVSASVGNLSFWARGLPPSQPALFFQGDLAAGGGAGTAFGDGLRCAGGAVVRLETVFASATGDAYSTVHVAGRGGVAAGDTKRYQCWYRDPLGSACGGPFNLTNGYEVVWVP